MQVTVPLVKAMTEGRGKDANIASVVIALNDYGQRFGMHLPHRLAHIFAQIMHETAYFRYDRELWNGKGAQARYEGRADLGNVRPGDGKKFKGHGPIQVTGRSNTTEFRNWCREFIPETPDFAEYPELINTDPYEGLTLVWYWATRKLNKFADKNDLYMVTKRVNGGTNGLAHRYECYDAAALALLGEPVGDIAGFQRKNGLVVDGDSGPETRGKMHDLLVSLKVPPKKPALKNSEPAQNTDEATQLAIDIAAVIGPYLTKG